MPKNNTNVEFKIDQHITRTTYWHFDSARSVVPRSVSYKLLAKIKRTVEKIFDIQILRNRDYVRSSEYVSFPLSPELIALRAEKLLAAVRQFFNQLGIVRSDPLIAADIDAYQKAFEIWPHKDLSGGMGFNNGLFLYCFVAALQPKTIIESGVWRGYTTFMLDHASAQQSVLHCFDINLSKLKWRSPRATYYENDMSQTNLNASTEPSLAFFDDHVSHYDRFMIGHKLGMKGMVFDDDVTHLSVHSDGWPPIPTISMLINQYRLPSKFEWMINSNHGVANFEINDFTSISDNYVFATPPDLFEITGYRDSSRTTYAVHKDL